MKRRLTPWSLFRKESWMVEKRCELCGKPIPSERLDALPQTRRCVDCARENGTDIHSKRVEIGMDLDTYRDLLRAVRS
ncbi:MAG: hypothetical protein GX855_10425 [Firmicutes bacterium]|nr:hypothetical protein [Bacillota bacterium]